MRTLQFAYVEFHPAEQTLAPFECSRCEQKHLGHHNPFSDPYPTGPFVFMKSQLSDLLSPLATESGHGLRELG